MIPACTRIAAAMTLLVSAPAVVGAQEQVLVPASTPEPVTDGPYVLWSGDTAATVLAVCHDTMRTVATRVTKGVLRFTHACTPAEEFTLAVSPSPTEPATFTNARRVFAVSDVEGEYDAFVALLQQAGVLDTAGHWAWGDGHLVLVGDMVDRGSHVTEVLWLIHRLEQEARRAGGRVHYVLGNHDAMLLYGDHRYVAPKYWRAADQLGVPLLKLFGPATEFGRWMRTKPVMVRLDSVLFVHGGIAPAFAARHGDLAAVNAAARTGLLDAARRTSDSLVAPVFGAEGPLWYRGYFGAATASAPTDIRDALARYGASTVVVGHTVVDTIKRLHEGRAVAIDVTFKAADRVEGLLIENGCFYRVTVSGARVPLE